VVPVLNILEDSYISQNISVNQILFVTSLNQLKVFSQVFLLSYTWYSHHDLAYLIIRVSTGDNYTLKTKQIPVLWEEIGHSGIWGLFMKAAEKGDHQQLKGTANVFCHI
jgi:hypothetical protein